MPKKNKVEEVKSPESEKVSKKKRKHKRKSEATCSYDSAENPAEIAETHVNDGRSEDCSTVTAEKAEKYKEKYKSSKLELSILRKELTAVKSVPQLDSATKEKCDKLQNKLDQTTKILARKSVEVEKKDKTIAQLSSMCDKNSSRAEKNAELVVQLKAKIKELETTIKEAGIGMPSNDTWLPCVQASVRKKKVHDNHHGKRLPADDVDTMHSRLEELDAKRDFVVIKRGRLMVNIPNAECRGYYSECGTNVIVPKESTFPDFILNYVEKQAHNLISENKIKVDDAAVARGEQPKQKSKLEESEDLYYEFVTTLMYTTYRDHQGPIYANGRKPFFRRSWLGDPNVTKSVILCDQPSLVIMAFDAADKVVPIGGSMEKKKKLTARTLSAIVNWHSKHANLVYKPGYSSGQTTKKMIVPSTFQPSADVVAVNNSLSPLPPVVNERQLQGPLYGESKACVERIRGNLSTSKGQKRKNSAITGASDGKEQKDPPKKKDKKEKTDSSTIEKKKGESKEKEKGESKEKEKGESKEKMPNLDDATLALLRSIKSSMK